MYVAMGSANPLWGSPPQCTPPKYGFDHSYGYFHEQIDPYTALLLHMARLSLILANIIIKSYCWPYI